MHGARRDLTSFLDQYGSRVDFEGFTWDVASKGFLEFLKINMVCSRCWAICKIKSNFDRYSDSGLCCKCGEAAVTTRPTKLLEIVNRHVPPGKIPLSYDVPDCAIEAGHIIRTKNEMQQFFANKRSGVEQVNIPFCGDCWDTATSSFLGHFARNAICVKCWHTTSLAKECELLKTIKAYETDEDFSSIVGDDLKCRHCGEKSATPRPKALIDIVNKNKPVWKGQLSFVEYNARVLPVAARVAKGLIVSFLSRYS